MPCISATTHFALTQSIFTLARRSKMSLIAGLAVVSEEGQKSLKKVQSALYLS